MTDASISGTAAGGAWRVGDDVGVPRRPRDERRGFILRARPEQLSIEDATEGGDDDVG